MVSKFMVATPLIAVAVLAIFLAWGHSFSSQASAVTPAMELAVKGGGVECPLASSADFCGVKGATFIVSVDLLKAPAGPPAGYIGIATKIDVGALVYKPVPDPDGPGDEVVWPPGISPLRSITGSVVTHADATGFVNPPLTTFVGNLVEIEVNCTSGNSTGNLIKLIPLDADNTDGTGIATDLATSISLGPDQISVDCVQTPTAPPPTATATAPDSPQMQKLCAAKGVAPVPPANASDGSAQCNLFLTRQGTKIPPVTCAAGNNAATFQERLSIPIPTLPDPKDPANPQELGAFEFEVHFNPDQVCVNIVPGTAITGTLENPATGQFICIIEDKDSSQLEGVARIGCVTVGKTFSIDTTTKAGRHLANVVVRPQPDLYSVIRPNQDNGAVQQLNNVACELADLQGHPIAVFSCEDADLTIRFLEGDVSPDCKVDALDTQAIAFRWGVNKGSLIFTNFMNLEPSGPQADSDIDIKDLQFVFGRFGSTCKVPHPPQPPVNAKA